MEAVGTSLRGVPGPARSSPPAPPGAVRDSYGRRQVSAGSCGRPESGGGCSGEGVQPRTPSLPPLPRSLRTRGDSAGMFEESHVLEGNKKENTPSSLKTPLGSRWLLPPLGLRPPTCQAPQSRAAAGTSLPAGIASAATPLRLFLSSCLLLLLLSPSPCCLGLFMEIHSFMPSHRSLSVSLPPGGRACDASPLSSHFLLSQSGAAPSPGGGRAGTRVGSQGRGSIPQCGVGMRGRGHGTDPLWGTRAFSGAHHPDVGAPAGLSTLPDPRRAAVRRRRGGVGAGGLHTRDPLVFSASPFSPQPVRHHTLHPRYIRTRRTPIHAEHEELTQARSGAAEPGAGEVGGRESTAPSGSPLCPAGYTVQSFPLPIAPLPLRFRGVEDPFLSFPPPPSSILLPAAPRCLRTTAGEVPGLI